jgi:ankyrin repeat protein
MEEEKSPFLIITENDENEEKEKIEEILIEMCIKEEQEENIKSFLEKNKKKININFQKKDEYKTALHYSTIKERLSLVDILIKYGADPNLADKFGSTPLHYASSKGNNEIGLILLGNGADSQPRDNNGQSPLHIATKAKYFEFVNILFLYGADINIKNNLGATILHECLTSGDVETLKFILKHLLKIGKKLHFNCRNNNKETPLFKGIESRNTEVTNLLLRLEFCDVFVTNEKKQNIFHISAINNSIDFMELEKVQKLFLKNSLMNEFDICQKTPLHYAAKFGHLEIVKLFSEMKCNLNLQDSQGNTALHLSIKENHNEVTQYLIKRGSKKNIKNKDNETALKLLKAKKEEASVEITINSNEVMINSNEVTISSNNSPTSGEVVNKKMKLLNFIEDQKRNSFNIFQNLKKKDKNLKVEGSKLRKSSNLL